MGKNVNTHFSKEHIEIANRHVKRWPTLLIIREMQIKSITVNHLTLVRMAIIINSKTTDAGEGIEKREPS